MKVPQAVKTKCVMGELTLGDVMNLINSRFSYVCVEQDGRSMGRYVWSIDEKSRLFLYCDENTPEYSKGFPLGTPSLQGISLKTKVQIKNDSVEWNDDGVKTCLQFLETKVIGLDGILPRRKE
jgi:hypothetical protein